MLGKPGQSLQVKLQLQRAEFVGVIGQVSRVLAPSGLPNYGMRET